MRVVGLNTPTVRGGQPFSASRKQRRDKNAALFSYAISEADPTVIAVPANASRELIAKHLHVAVDAFDFVHSAKSRASGSVGIRVQRPSDLPADLAAEMRVLLEAAVAKDVRATLDELKDSDPSETTITLMTFRWARRSLYLDSAGTSYFDRFLAGLHRVKLTDSGVFWNTTKTGLEWLVKEADRSRERIKKLILLNSRKFRSFTGYASRDRAPVKLIQGDDIDPMARRLAVVGRYYYGDEGDSVQLRAFSQLAASRDRQQALFETRNAPWMGARAVIPRPDGMFIGYGLRPSLVLGPLDSDPLAQSGSYHWYYPGTVGFAPGEFDTRPSKPTPPDRLWLRRYHALTEGLEHATSANPLSIINLDFGVLSQATLDQRIQIFRIMGASKYRSWPLGVALMARTIASMPAADLPAFDRALMKKGMLDKLVGRKGGAFGALGRAYTLKALEAGTSLKPKALANAPSMNEGKAGGFVHYWVAKVVDAKGGGRQVRLEPGAYRDQWTDTARWQHDPSQGANYAPSRLMRIHKFGSKGGERYVSALEAALLAGDPKSDANSSDLLDFIGVVLAARAGISVQSLFRQGIMRQIFRAPTWRAGVRALASQGARKAALDAGEAVIFHLDQAVSKHSDELSKTAAGRAFLNVYQLAGAAFLARDLYRLGQSGILQHAAKSGYAAVATLGGSAARSLRRRVDDLKAFSSAVDEAIRQKIPLDAMTATPGGALSMGAHAGNARKFQHILLSKRLEQTGKGLAGELTGVASKRAETATKRFASAAELATKTDPVVAQRLRRALDATRTMAPADAKHFLRELDKLLGESSDRVIGELSGFIEAGARSGNPSRYLKATRWIASRNLGPSALKTLGGKASRQSFDLEWFQRSSLADDLSDPKLLPGKGVKTPLQLLAENPGTNWGLWKRASDEAAEALTSGTKVSERTLIDLNVSLRGSAGEVVTEAELPRLFPRRRLSQRHKELSVSGAKKPTPGDKAVLDYELTGVDEDVVVYLDSKAITEASGKGMLDELKRINHWEEATGATERLMKQIQAAWVHSGRRPPIVAIPSNLSASLKKGLKERLSDFHKTKVVEVSGASIDELSRIIRAKLGVPARKGN